MNIAAKYKTYGRLRALESKSDSRNDKDTEKKPDHTRTKRKHEKTEEDYLTPKKPRGNLLTPAKNRHPAALDPYDSPSVFRRLFSPSTHRQTLPSPVPLKTAIGPTPQRDGKALGLFDLLSASGGSTATPSSKRMASVAENDAKTPSGGKRKRDDNDDDEDENTIRMGRTPASSSKKLYLERLFATPTTMRFATMVEDEERQPPAYQNPVSEETQTNPLSSETPSFLRRSNSGRYVDPAHALSPVGVRKPRRFVGKGLSALVQGLRDMEEERMQDDWDVLKEMEAENNSGTGVEVKDSQAEPQDEGPVWKKKAPKRTTRLVRLKPVMQTKPKAVVPTVDQDQPDEEESENEEDPDFTEPNTKKPSIASSFSEKIKAMISDVKNKNPLGNATSSANNPTSTTSTKAKNDNAEKATKKRKVNPDAHANYRSLKIRSKGQGRFGKRFGRR